MSFLETIFILISFLIFYTYFGYPLLIFLILKIPIVRKFFKPPKNAKPKKIISDENYLPKVTLIISAYKESKETIKQKIQNTLELDYPRNKLKVILALAMNSNPEIDEALFEYYDNFLKEPDPTLLKTSDEEIYIKFLKYEDINDRRNDEVLLKYQNELFELNIDSESVSPNAKKILDKYFSQFNSENELNISITKDIQRKGKLSQIIRTLQFAEGEIIIFSDANSYFNKDAIKKLVRHFVDESVGCVAGEKRIARDNTNTENAEGIYWKYESFLKKMDSELWSTIGAAGELFAVRKELCEKYIVKNAIIEDFVLSMNICRQGYRVVYEPDAYALEEPTKNIKSEFKRKIRIIAGGFQAIFLFKDLFNIAYYKTLSFQYISHRLLRWAITPFLFPIIYILNIFLINNFIFLIIFILQNLFYLSAFIGYLLEKINIKIRIFHITYYFLIINIAAYIGLYRYLTNKQKLTWEKVR